MRRLPYAPPTLMTPRAQWYISRAVPVGVGLLVALVVWWRLGIFVIAALFGFIVGEVLWLAVPQLLVTYFFNDPAILQNRPPPNEDT